MIINFSIQNFGCIKERQTLSFEAKNNTVLEDYYIVQPITGLRLVKLGLIYGANASGKTTVLKALDFLRNIVLNPADKKTERLDFQPFLFDNDTIHQGTQLTIEFIQNKIRYFYEVVLTQNAILKEILYFHKPNKALVFSRFSDIEKQLTHITFGSKIKKDKSFETILQANTLWNNTVLGGFLKTNIERIELKEVTDWFSTYMNPLILTNTELQHYITKKIDKKVIQKETLIEILQQADFNISDIVIRPKEDKQSVELKNIAFEHTIQARKYQLSFELESHGTQRYYGFAGLLSLLIENAVLFSIDELEASLHPDLYLHFLLSFLKNAKNSQIVATTHNRELLNNKDLFRNDAIWFMDKNESCATELYSLADFDSKVIRDTNNIYNAYKVGKLGGVPNLGDHFITIL
jgi:AAA15 family ATPase/GTPase